MKLLDVLFAAVLASSAFGLISCSHENPPFPELRGTRWSATNIAAGVLIDIRFSEVEDNDVRMTYYHDAVPYGERGPVIDTVGNRCFGMCGIFIPVESETDRGEHVFGYEWDVHLVKDDGTELSGGVHYDNRRMYLRMDGAAYPMAQVD